MSFCNTLQLIPESHTTTLIIEVFLRVDLKKPLVLFVIRYQLIIKGHATAEL